MADDRDDIPEGDEGGRKRRDPMPKEDKIVGGVVLFVLAGLCLLGLYLIRWGMSVLGIALSGATGGLGFGDAFVPAVIVSTLFMIVFALVAGDGAVGELPTMIVGFFIMVAFFNVSIAMVL